QRTIQPPTPRSSLKGPMPAATSRRPTSTPATACPASWTRTCSHNIAIARASMAASRGNETSSANASSPATSAKPPMPPITHCTSCMPLDVGCGADAGSAARGYSASSRPVVRSFNPVSMRFPLPRTITERGRGDRPELHQQRTLSIDQRQPDRELGALTGYAGAEHADVAVVAAHHLVHHAQPDAQAALPGDGCVVALGEQLEDVVELVGWDARPVVGDAEVGGAGAAAQAHAGAAAFGCELDRVVEQVVEHLHQADLVADHPQRLVGDLGGELLATGLHGRGRGLDGRVHHLLQSHGLAAQVDLATDDAPDVQQVVDQPRELADLARQDVPGGAQVRGGGLFQLHDGHRVADRRQRVAQLVAEHCQEVMEVALLGLQPGDAAAVAEVAGDLGEPQVVTGSVVHGGDEHAGPEPAAVLADAPALVLEAAVAQRGFKFVLGPAGVDLFLRVEHREVLADDLLGGIALVDLGAEVPADHVALRVQHENGVVAHAFHQHAEALFALAQQLLLVASLGEVAGDLGETAVQAVVVDQRGDDHARPEPAAILAQAPAFVLEPPQAERFAQLLRRETDVDLLLRVEDLEAAADDLVRRVALEHLCRGVPGAHASVRVGTEDGGLPDGFRRQAAVAVADRRRTPEIAGRREQGLHDAGVPHGRSATLLQRPPTTDTHGRRGQQPHTLAERCSVPGEVTRDEKAPPKRGPGSNAAGGMSGPGILQHDVGVAVGTGGHHRQRAARQLLQRAQVGARGGRQLVPLG